MMEQNNMHTRQSTPGIIVSLAAACRRRLGQWHDDQSGATLTEFVVVLPLFLLVFNAVIVLGQFTRKATETPIRAYKKTFKKLSDFQDSYSLFNSHAHPSAAALDETIKMSNGFTSHNNSGLVSNAGGTGANAVWVAGMGAKGSMGESFARTKSAGLLPISMDGCDSYAGDECIGMSNKLTKDITDIVGKSKHANALFNDAIQPKSLKSGGGWMQTINNLITATGVRPILAANPRYGTIAAKHEESITFAGQTMDTEAHFDVLVPPTPKPGNLLDEATPMAASRFALEGQDHYSDLLGIDWEQPLSSESFNVDSYE